MKNLFNLFLLTIGLCLLGIKTYSQRYNMSAEVICTKSQDMIGNDQIYLLIEHKNGTTTKTPVYEIRETEKITMGKAIEVMDEDVVKLFEYDEIDSDDLLLTLTISKGEGDGKNYHTFSDPDASFNYSIFYTLTPVEVNIKTDDEH